MKGQVGCGTVYLIGAGASRAVCEPMPLISDFFKVRSAELALAQDAFRHLPEVLSRYGFNSQKKISDWNIETILSRVMEKEEASWRFSSKTNDVLDFIFCVLWLAADRQLLKRHESLRQILPAHHGR